MATRSGPPALVRVTWLSGRPAGADPSRMAVLRRSAPVVGLVMALLTPAVAAAYTGSGTVQLVVDGDTVQVDVAGDDTSSGVHVRNAGIQAMEKGQCGAQQAADAMAGLVGAKGSTVKLSATYASSTSLDGDGRVRPLRYIDTPSGTDTQVELLRKGLVLAYPLGKELARQDLYQRTAEQAALAGAGLYSRQLCAPGPDQDAKLRLWVNWDADGNDATNITGEYVRIHNEGSRAIDLSGWWVRSPSPSTFTFPTGTTIAAGGLVTLHSGTGTRTSTDFYWGDSASRFYNPSPSAVHAFSGYLYDPDGDLRAWSFYPCSWGCQEPLSTTTNVAWTAVYDPPGNEADDPNTETINLTNTSKSRIDASFRVVTLLGYVHEFGPGSYVDPGETLKVHVGRGTDSRLHKYLDRDKATLANAGGSVVLRNVEGVQIGCARWGDGGPQAYQCTPTTLRTLDRVGLGSVDDGRALRVTVVPRGTWDYTLQRWDGARWVGAASGTTPSSGVVDLVEPEGRYRVSIPAQDNFRAGTSSELSLARVAPAAQLSGRLSAPSGTVGVLRVDIDPDRSGTANWTFGLQRRSAGGDWSTVGTYTTTGGSEQRDLRYLASGTYRAYIPSQAGGTGAVTAALDYTAPRATLSVKVSKRSKLVIDAGPSLSGTTNYTARIQRRSGGKWKAYRTVTTQGSAEKVTVNVKRGYYRVVLANQHGYLGVTTGKRWVAR